MLSATKISKYIHYSDWIRLFSDYYQPLAGTINYRLNENLLYTDCLLVAHVSRVSLELMICGYCTFKQ